MPGNTPGIATASRSEKNASMRPQRNAGEYCGASINGQSERTGFNEAPAKCRGIPIRRGAAVNAHIALQ